jgi:flagellar hook-length control protein FliK
MSIGPHEAPLPGIPNGAVASGPQSTSAARANDIDAAPSVLESARFVQTPDRSEMHVGLRSESLGQVSVHAVMTNGTPGSAAGSSVGASIAVQDHAAHALLMRDLPALQSQLQERNIHLDKITVLSDSAHSGSSLSDPSSGGTPQQSGSSQQSQSRQQRAQYPGSAESLAFEQDQPLAVSWNSTGGRLSIRA